MKRKMYAYALILSMGLLWGCYPQGAEYVDEYDIVYTNYDQTYAFQSKGTYSLPDKIVKITGKEGEPPEYVKDVYATQMLQQIDANMAKYGWSKVDVNSNPDIQLLPAVSTSTTIIYGGYYGGYWCWYYPYYCGGGWYYPYPIYSSYTTGSLLMTMVDPSLESTDGSKQVVWSGIINGLLQGTYNVSRVNKGIDQAFTQSTYLKTN